MTDRHMVRIAVYVILEQEGNIFLLRRHNTGYADGQYTLPAGHVDEGESFLQAAVRELDEEVGVTLSQDELSHVHTLYRSRPDAVYVDVFFRAASWKGTPYNKEADKCDDASWFPQDSLPKSILPHVELVLTQVRNEVHYSEYIVEE